jgi:hypothetical protein
MTAAIFTEWVNKQLLPALKTLTKPCVIIMDNAPYHSHQIDKAPVSSTKKAEMLRWLNINNIAYPQEASKKVLWDIIRVKKQNVKKSYVIDELINSKAGYTHRGKNVQLKVYTLVLS